MANIRIAKSPQSRAWLFPNGNNPKNKGELLICHRIVDPSRSYGDPEPIYKPSQTRFGGFDEIDSIDAAPERATFSIENYYSMDSASIFLKLANLKCSSDLHVVLGSCNDPRVYNSSWEKLIIFEDVKITSHSIGDLGALQPGDAAATLETIELSARRYYEVTRLTVQRVNATLTTPTAANWVQVYGSEECVGDGCSDNIPGCLTQLTGGSGNILQFTNNLGSTIGQTTITTIVGNSVSAAIAGDFVYVISDSDAFVHYADIEDILQGTEIWGTIDLGIAGFPTAITNSNSQDVWVTDSLGNIHLVSGLRLLATRQLTTDPLTGVVVDDCCVLAWSATEMFHSNDEGQLFGLITPPAAITNIASAEFTPSAYTNDSSCSAFIVSGETGTYCTTDLGNTWQEVGLPVPGFLKRINRATRAVLYGIMEASTGGTFLVRSTDGGCSWTLLPDKPQKLVADAANFTCIDTCPSNPNTLSIVGEDVNGAGGWWIGSGPESINLGGFGN